MKAKQLIWVTRDGQKIPFRNLSDNHLINIIRMLERCWEKQYKHMCNHMDDGRTIASASDCMPAPAYDWAKPPQYDTLVLIAQTRGLDV